MSLKSKAVTSVKWTSAGSVVCSALDFFQLFIVARLLSPEDIGLMAMVNIVLGFGQQYADVGLSAAIIHKHEIRREQLSSLYWLNLAMGLLIYGVCVALSPLIAAAFGEPRLLKLIVLAALIFLVAPLGLQFRTLLQKSLRFEVVSIIDVMAELVGTATAIVMAYSGFGVLSLVFARLVMTTVSSLFLLTIGLVEWRPQLAFRFSDLNGFVGFGLYQLGQRSLAQLLTRLDQILLGGVLGAAPLGYYTLGLNIVLKPISRINPVLTTVVFPVLARVQHDNTKLRVGYLTVLKVLSFINFPVLIGLAATASSFVPLFLGEKWMPSVIFIQILAFVSMLRSVNLGGILFLAKGRADIGFKWYLLVFCILAPALYTGAVLKGAIGTALMLLASQMLLIILGYFILIRASVGPCFKAYSASMGPTFLISVCVGIAAYGIAAVIPTWPLIYVLVLQIVAGVIVYASLNYLFYQKQCIEIRDLLLNRNA